eukprot:8831834-Lingulodinium_polyedra.AAC.1
MGLVAAGNACAVRIVTASCTALSSPSSSHANSTLKLLPRPKSARRFFSNTRRISSNDVHVSPSI